MNSNHHNLPEVNGQTQQPGRAHTAKEVDYTHSEDAVSFSLDMASAYPAEAGLNAWKRTVTLERSSGVTIEDQATFGSDGGEVVFHLMTACDVDVGDGELVLQEVSLPDGRSTGSGRIVIDDGFSVSLDKISLDDGERLHKIWGSYVTRVLLKADQLGASESWKLEVRW